MKWAPNKRLHFEVAVIKAIQTLNQVTLNEVIENLAALRDGKQPVGRDSVEPRPAPPKSAPTSPPPKSAPEKVLPSEPAVPAQTAPSVDPTEAWKKTVEKVRATRRL